MPLLTTTIGAYPKPDYLELPDWFTHSEGPDTLNPTAHWTEAMHAMGADAKRLIARAVGDAVHDQVDAGVDIPTDGEIPRENYIHYHCRHLSGMSFDTLTKKDLRGGAYSAHLPTVTGAIAATEPFLPRDWQRAQACTERTVKITMPGPMTIADTTADAHYGDPQRLGAALAGALNQEVHALADAGCRYIQIDEPVFARNAGAALEFGLENLERAFHGCPPDVTRAIHICCGYPDRLDNPDYPKAPKEAYLRLADAIEDSSVQAVSLEDAHRPNDLALLERFRTTTVILGVVAIAKSDVEDVDQIRERLTQALAHIDAERLIAAPDCGLGLLGRTLALEKLRNLCTAARQV